MNNEKKKPKVLYDGKVERVWMDINGNIWKHNKDTHELYKNIHTPGKGDDWERIDGVILDDLKRDLQKEFTSPYI